MSRSNLKIKVGTYIGNAADLREITDVGFRPHIVIIKGGSNAVVIRTKSMSPDSTGILSQSSANQADAIQGFFNNGFQLGTHARVNANGTVYTYIAIRSDDSQNYFGHGVYVGDGLDDRNITNRIYFEPDFVQLIAESTAAKIWTSSAASLIGRNSRWDATATGTNTLQDLIENGFQVGTGTTANGAGINYHFFAFKSLAGVMAVGEYTGDGNDNRSISGLGFQPDIVMVKRDGATVGAMRTSIQTGDDTLVMSASANAANMIQALESDGFQVGTDIAVNNGGDTYHWVAFKAGNFNVPLERTAI